MATSIEWAGKFRTINIKKREKVLAGVSVWYSDVDAIERDLAAVWQTIGQINWAALPREAFVGRLVDTFPQIWKVHPFREGNTRTIVMLMTFFIERHGYFVDQDLLAANAGYVRNALVMASLDNFAEREHLERILLDAVTTEPVEYDEFDSDVQGVSAEHRSPYQSEDYQPAEHEPRFEEYDPEKYRM